jgi:hypothetical protein
MTLLSADAAPTLSTYSIGESFSLRTREYDRVPLPSIPAHSVRRATVLLGGAILSGSAILTALAVRPDQSNSDSVGVIDGESIAVNGPMKVEVVGGQVKTLLRSGSDVRVNFGTARIDLVEGGQISICGPARLSVLKSGGALTVALSAGTIHAYIEREPVLTIYTAQIHARPIAIGDGPEDVLVGFEAPRGMCIRANRGAIRVEQQLTGQSVIIPQTGDVLLPDSQIESLRTGAGHCVCELQTAKAAPATEFEVSRPATPEEVRKNALDTKADPPAPAEKPAVKEEPIYQVFMPPLIYDAKAKVQPEVDPKMIVLVRRVRVRPTLIFQGRVEGEMVAAATPALPSAPGGAPSGSPRKGAAPANDSFIRRVRNFVRKLWSRGA